MVDKIIDIEIALENGAYLSALALALTLPAIGGKIAYPVEKLVSAKKLKDKQDKNKYRVQYESWIDEWFTDDLPRKCNIKMFNGEMCYQLRKSFLHEGNIKVKNIKNFDLTYGDGGYRYEITTSCNGEEENTISIDVVALCRDLCAAAELFYVKNRNNSSYDFGICHANIDNAPQRDRINKEIKFLEELENECNLKN